MNKLGIDIGGTNIKLVIIDESNEILASDIFPTPHINGIQSDDYSIENAIVDGIDRVLAANNLNINDIEQAGLTVPGVLKVPKGPVYLAPNIGWKAHDPISYLEGKLNIPFSVGNDADCMALAESVMGAGRRFGSFVMIAIGTGIGGSIVNNGKVFTGFTPCGGELGHVPFMFHGQKCNCGNEGCYEQYASATALKRITREMTGENWSPVQLFKALENGDKRAEEVVDLYAEYLTQGIAGFVNVLRPEGVIIGGGVANSGAPLFDRVNAMLPKFTFCNDIIQAPPVVPAELGMFVGALGAALL